MSESNNNYWTKDTDNYIIKWQNELDIDKKNDIFNNYIYNSFKKLSENIVNNHRNALTYINKDHIQYDIMSHMSTALDKFNIEKCKCGFSFFNTVGKNYLLRQNMKGHNYSKKTDPLLIENESGNTIENPYILQDYSYNITKDKEFLNTVISYLKDNSNLYHKNNKYKKLTFDFIISYLEGNESINVKSNLNQGRICILQHIRDIYNIPMYKINKFGKKTMTTESIYLAKTMNTIIDIISQLKKQYINYSLK